MGLEPLPDDELVHSERLSPNCNDRKLPVTMAVIHYTEMENAAVAIDRLCDPQAQVSAHYLIAQSGEVTRMVPEEKRAWHAGKSSWRGVTDVNSASVGIELDNMGHYARLNGDAEAPLPPYTPAQIASLVRLLARIVKRFDIPRANVVAHSDIAPSRKIDPGEHFPWEVLADHGLCLARPEKLELGDPFDNDGAFFLALERFGYDISDEPKAVEAFQRRWRPERIDGKVDAQVRAILFRILLDRDRGAAR
jgi:N-acetylmuramoyl-L-alanine amidase